MTTSAPPDECIHQAMCLFSQLHEAPTLQTAERLVCWLAESACHVQALDLGLTDMGLRMLGQALAHDRPAGSSPAA